MSDEILDQYTTEPAWVTETEKEGLIPTGTYEGQITGYTVKEGTRDPFFGTHLVRLQTELYNVDGQSQRMHFFDVCPKSVTRGDGRQTAESRLWTQLAKVTGTVGKTATDTLTVARTLRLRFRVRLAEEQDRDGKHYDARNWTDAISAVR